jgi:hypothetical protein
MKMTRVCAYTLIVLAGLTATLAAPARAQRDIMSDNYGIMVPEKGYKPSAAGALAGAEIQIAARYGEACDHSEADQRADAEYTGPSRFVRAPDRADVAEFADRVGIGSRRSRNLSGSRNALLSSGRRIRPGCRQQLHGYLR